MTKKCIMLAAGGTGGHMFPAEALGRSLMAEGYDIVLVTDVRGAKFEIFAGDAKEEVIAAATFKPGITAKIMAVVSILMGLMQSIRLILKYKPVAIIGFGGYPSLPPVLTGQLLFRTTILHNLDAAFGKANKVLAWRAKGIAAGHPMTSVTSPSLTQKIQVTGNPVRAEFEAKRDAAYTAPEKDAEFRIFIMGGSLGARIFSDTIPAALGKLPEQMKTRLRVVQQCRGEDLSAARTWYEKINLPVELAEFFDDVETHLADCHLFIGRSGASTVTEVSIVGRPAIFIPMSLHADQQQMKNAESLANQGGAWIIPQADFTPVTLAEKIEDLMNNPDQLTAAATAAKNCGQPDATRNLTRFVCGLIDDTMIEDADTVTGNKTETA